MDRYPLGLQQYRAAKLRIYENAKTCVVNADDALTMPVRGADERCISFGVDVGDYHLNRQQGETWLRVKGEKVLNVKEMPLTGQHNYSNALAALALADAAGLPRASSLKALTTLPVWRTVSSWCWITTAYAGLTTRRRPTSAAPRRR